MDIGASEKPKVKIDCAYCGNNPVPHFLYWFFESGNLLLTPIRQFLLHNPLARGLNRVERSLNLVWHLVRLGRVLRIIGLQDDISRCKVPRAKVLWQAAAKRGITMRALLLFGRPFDAYIAEKNYPSSLIFNPSRLRMKDKGLRIIFSGLPRPDHSDDTSLDWMDDKWLFKRAMLANHLPAPKGGCAWNFGRAKKIFDDIQAKRLPAGEAGYPLNAPPLPVIIKPRAGSRGRHSTTFVSSVDDLKKAFTVAKQLCFWVIIEEQLSGPVYRATLINYELCGCLRGDSPQVIGDGLRTVDELIDIKNRNHHAGVKDIVSDESMESFLNRQHPHPLISPLEGEGKGGVAGRRSALSYIPKKDQVIHLSEKIGVNYGGSSSEDYAVCHPDNKALFIQAARTLGDPIVGFDFIIPDITQSWQAQKCGFIEANSLPFINLHHDPLLGEPRNVAAKVWKMVGM